MPQCQCLMLVCAECLCLAASAATLLTFARHQQLHGHWWCTRASGRGQEPCRAVCVTMLLALRSMRMLCRDAHWHSNAGDVFVELA